MRSTALIFAFCLLSLITFVTVFTFHFFGEEKIKFEVILGNIFPAVAAGAGVVVVRVVVRVVVVRVVVVVVRVGVVAVVVVLTVEVVGRVVAGAGVDVAGAGAGVAGAGAAVAVAGVTGAVVVGSLPFPSIATLV